MHTKDKIIHQKRYFFFKGKAHKTLQEQKILHEEFLFLHILSFSLSHTCTYTGSLKSHTLLSILHKCVEISKKGEIGMFNILISISLKNRSGVGRTLKYEISYRKGDRGVLYHIVPSSLEDNLIFKKCPTIFLKV